MHESASAFVSTPLLESAESPLLCTLPLVSPTSPLIDAPIAALIDDAAAAGFGAVSVCVGHPAWGIAGDAAADRFFGRLAEAPLPVRVAEVIDVDLWGAVDQRAEQTRMLDLAVRTGADRVNAIAFQPDLPPLRQAGANLARLCDLAAERDLKISFEFLPFTGVAGIATAARLLEAADRDNLGIVFDLWHWFRSPEGQDVAALRSIPPDRIHVLQLDDAPARPADDLVVETVTARLLPGEGDVDIVEVLEALDEMGAAPVVASEVFSDELVALGPAENARRQHAGVRALLREYRASGRADPSAAAER